MYSCTLEFLNKLEHVGSIGCHGKVMRLNFLSYLAFQNVLESLSRPIYDTVRVFTNCSTGNSNWSFEWNFDEFIKIIFKKNQNEKSPKTQFEKSR